MQKKSSNFSSIHASEDDFLFFMWNEDKETKIAPWYERFRKSPVLNLMVWVKTEDTAPIAIWYGWSEWRRGEKKQQLDEVPL